MRIFLSVLSGVVFLLGFLGAPRAEDPGSFLDIRLSAAPYSRQNCFVPQDGPFSQGDYEKLQQLNLGLSLGFLRHGFVAFEMGHAVYQDEPRQSYRALAGFRLRGLELLDAAGNGLLLESALSLGYLRTLVETNEAFFRMSMTGLYWFWKGRLAAGVELGYDIGNSTGVHASLLTAVAFPWPKKKTRRRSQVRSWPARPPIGFREDPEAGSPPEKSLDVRLRVSAPYTKINLPEPLGLGGIGASVEFMRHLLVEYTLDWVLLIPSHSKTLSHTFAFGGRLRGVDSRNGAGRGWVVDTALVLGYAHYVHQWQEGVWGDVDALILRLDWEPVCWITGNFGVGLWASLGFTIPFAAGEEDTPASHLGAGAALVFAAAF